MTLYITALVLTVGNVPISPIIIIQPDNEEVTDYNFKCLKRMSKRTSSSSSLEPSVGPTVCTSCVVSACHVMFLNFTVYGDADHGANLRQHMEMRSSACAAATN